jgi:hypothetical protein
MKRCTKCKIEKNYSLYSKRKMLKDGYRSQCKQCDANDIIKNKERHTISVNNNYQKNKEAILEHKKIYRSQNKEKRKIIALNYSKRRNFLINERKKIDPVFACKYRIRKLIAATLKNKGFTKNSETYKILGCDFDFFKNYIENQFIKGMTWDNIHLDHIKPIYSAKTEKEVYELNHYTNFQPLFKLDNLQKGKKLIEKQLKCI